MKLIVENFRCYSGVHEWNFDDTGITLLSGKSGSGKTSLLMAINFVIHNSKKNQKLITDGKTFLRVELQYKNCKIIRTKKPERLLFYENISTDRYVEDDEAQSFVDRIFGAHFEYISYIPQQYEKSFIYQDPSEKLKLLERLSFPDDNKFHPEILKKKCNDTLKDFSDRIYILNGKKLEIERFLIKECICPEFMENPMVTELFCVEKLEELKIEEKNIQDIQYSKHRYEYIVNEILLYDRELSDMSINSSLHLCNLSKQNIFEQIAFHDELEKLNKESIDTPWIKYTKEEANEILMDYERDVALLNEYNIICNQLDPIVQFKKELDSLEKEKTRLEKTCDAQYICPNCNIFLLLKDRQLYIADDKNKDDLIVMDIETKKNLLKNTMSQIESMSKKTKSFDFLLEKKNAIGKNIDITDDVESLRKDLLWLKNYIQNNQVMEKEMEKKSERKKVLLEKILKNTSKSELLKQLEKIEKQKMYTDKREKLNLELITLQSEVENKNLRTMLEIEQDRDFYNDLQKKCIKFENHKRELEIWNNFIDNKKRLTQIEYEISKTKKKYDGCIELKQLVLRTESEIIEKNMEQISNLVNLYCSRIFENPIYIELATQKKTPNQTEKFQIHLNVQYKGIQCDVSYLSGGEQSRLNLAFILAFAHVFQSPLLLLDECTSNLDQELTDIVIEQISDVQIPKVILIAHQIVEGKFEEIIHC